MAEIKPFRGILYDMSRVDANKVLAPPYDVIDDGGREKLESLDPHNSVRLILPQGEGDSKYGRAAETMAAWIKDGILGRDAPRNIGQSALETSVWPRPRAIRLVAKTARMRVMRDEDTVLADVPSAGREGLSRN